MSKVLTAEPVTVRLNNGPAPWTRRTCLPRPRAAPGGPSLWNLLYKNIGKDLSQISMPVTINEPLNMLQRLCEELEYSELLDAASECSSSVERMALVAAFAVSSYAAAAHRAASKPFNPLLGETYECKRDDRNFRFLAEQRMALVAAFAVSSYAAAAHRAASKPFNPLLGETYECKRDDRNFRFLAEQPAIERMALVAAFAVSSYAAVAHRAASKPFNPLLGETYECKRDDRNFRFLAEQTPLLAISPHRALALVAAFAVSSYAAAAHRAASKPFNPLLGETYECKRDDRNFRFLAEQVSHHPPISACYAESPRWCLWQDARIKTKFWGKSMEFQPAGQVHLRLLGTGDHYSWNKVTTCVHNLFGGQRWVDQYGDMHITCHNSDITCKLNFVKASSWSTTRHEVKGHVSEPSTGTRLRLQGRWSEALHAGEPPANRCLWRPAMGYIASPVAYYNAAAAAGRWSEALHAGEPPANRCLWRHGAMPPEHELYYGFTRFAMELNELEPGMRETLPPTDTRLRPDQRALEEGDVESAERLKHQLEQTQRERRRDHPAHTPAWFRLVGLRYVLKKATWSRRRDQHQLEQTQRDHPAHACGGRLVPRETLCFNSRVEGSIPGCRNFNLKSIENGEEMWVYNGEYWKAREEGFAQHKLSQLW
ncbi:unnamed protein product [Plutella xylostella]|uniref:Oxysterol-binding protein n=1 Tax=Plutella xylostella TaxID=51655 RepID=A0A8S4FUJ4_PLUXY|nr:unnamed protein product [Plutella xylostella]